MFMKVETGRVYCLPDMYEVRCWWRPLLSGGWQSAGGGRGARRWGAGQRRRCSRLACAHTGCPCTTLTRTLMHALIP